MGTEVILLCSSLESEEHPFKVQVLHPHLGSFPKTSPPNMISEFYGLIQHVCATVIRKYLRQVLPVWSMCQPLKDCFPLFFHLVFPQTSSATSTLVPQLQSYAQKSLGCSVFQLSLFQLSPLHICQNQ